MFTGQLVQRVRLFYRSKTFFCLTFATVRRTFGMTVKGIQTNLSFAQVHVIPTILQLRPQRPLSKPLEICDHT